MPRGKSKTVRPEAKSTDSAASPARGAKTAAIRSALKAHPRKAPREIAELLGQEGWSVTAQSVSMVKSKSKGKKKGKKAAPAAVAQSVPSVPKDAVSVALLRKAKKLVKELGGIKEASTAINALAQLLD
ncbi:MAG: hypothetical protein FJ276_12035 [Planctomycetes bacterium]|nr:hypothetical protein [Planctomycetota bacterium]